MLELDKNNKREIAGEIWEKLKKSIDTPGYVRLTTFFCDVTHYIENKIPNGTINKLQKNDREVYENKRFRPVIPAEINFPSKTFLEKNKYAQELLTRKYGELPTDSNERFIEKLTYTPTEFLMVFLKTCYEQAFDTYIDKNTRN